MNTWKIKSLIKNSVEHHTLIYDITSFLIYKCGYGTMDMSRMLPHRKVYFWLKKRFSKYLGSSDFNKFINQKDMSNDTVWTCWFQGEDEAPYLVKCCFASMRYHMKDKNIIVLTKDNFRNYCTIPENIIEKWEKGIISYPHFSDILRTQVLIEHGGLWVDSTTYFTGDLPDYISGNDFFVYRYGWFDYEAIHMCNWLIYSKPQNKLLCETLNLLYSYWNTYDYVKSYYVYHLFFRMVTEKYEIEWSKTPYINALDQLIFSDEFLKSFDKKRFESLKTLTPIHKLTNKFDKNRIQENSYYSQLDELYK